MAFRRLLRQRAVLPIAGGTLLGSLTLYPAVVYAESPEVPTEIAKKPIYDDPTPPSKPSAESSETTETSKSPIAKLTEKLTSSKSEDPPATKPTVTDRLTNEVRRARLALFAYSTRAEGAVNRGMSRFLDAEADFTSTIASLKPPPSANEPLLPGLVYVLVATMAGSIFTRNRNILLRATLPVAFGVAAGWVVIPVTMRNVGDLAWKYEKKFPAVADAHIKTRERLEYYWATSKAHSAMTVGRAEEFIDETKEKIENWVKEGK